MSIMSTLREMGGALDGVARMHQSATYLHESAKKTVANSKIKEHVPITIEAPARVLKNATVLIQGTAPLGFVSVYSYDVKERPVVVVQPDHKYYTRLFFSKVGYYELYVKYLDVVKSDTIMVECYA